MIDQVRTFFAARLSQMKEKGASAVEYGLLVAGIAALIVVAVMTLGPVIKDAFNDTCATIQTERASSGGSDAGSCRE